jgi:hypothetical protein
MKVPLLRKTRRKMRICLEKLSVGGPGCLSRISYTGSQKKESFKLSRNGQNKEFFSNIG